MSWILLALLGAFYWFGILFFSFHVLGKLAYQIELTDPAETGIAITTSAHTDILKAEESLRSLNAGGPEEDLTKKRRKILEDLQRDLQWRYKHPGFPSREECESRAKKMVETFEQRGSAAFRPVKDPGLRTSPLERK